MVYLHLFGTENEFSEEYYGSGYTEPWVSYTLETSAVNYNNNTNPLQKTPFTIQFVDTNSLYVTDIGVYDLEYRLNGGQWTPFPTDTLELYFSEGDEISFKGTQGTLETKSLNTFIQDKYRRMNVYGNIMSIVAGDGFESATTINNGFVDFFQDWYGLISAENLLLPATTLSESCYSGMFSNCTGLTKAPSILPATTLTDSCYYHMFDGCSSLTTAPELPATTLAYDCYDDMFGYCASLTQAPALPATALSEQCYYWMFIGCESLTTAPELPATTLAAGCYSSMFYGCTGLTSAPELPALTLTGECYANMFQYCSSLNYIKCLATDISAGNCTGNWVDGVSGSGTFVKNPSMTSWPTGGSGIPSGWTTQNG